MISQYLSLLQLNKEKRQSSICKSYLKEQKYNDGCRKSSGTYNKFAKFRLYTLYRLMIQSDKQILGIISVSI